MDLIPKDIILEIFFYIDLKEKFIVLPLVCSLWNQYLKDCNDKFWKKVAIHLFPIMEMIDPKSNFNWKSWLWNKKVRILVEMNRMVQRLKSNYIHFREDDFKKDRFLMHKIAFLKKKKDLDIAESRTRLLMSPTELKMLEFLKTCIIPIQFLEYEINTRVSVGMEETSIEFYCYTLDGKKLEWKTREETFIWTSNFKLTINNELSFNIFKNDSERVDQILNLVFPKLNYNQKVFSPIVIWNLLGWDDNNIKKYIQYNQSCRN